MDLPCLFLATSVIFVILGTIYGEYKFEIKCSVSNFFHNHMPYRIVRYDWQLFDNKYERYYIEKRFLFFFYKKLKILYEVENSTNKDNITYYELKKRNENYFNSLEDAKNYVNNFLKKPTKEYYYID